MKSKFAKFVDYTVGAAMLFAAACAVFCYYLPLKLALFSAGWLTAACVTVARAFSVKKQKRAKLSRAADDMFVEFMFLPHDAPARLLLPSLKQKYGEATRRGGSIYVNDVAAHFYLFETDEVKIARLIAKSERYGAKKIVLFFKSAPKALPKVNGLEIKSVQGEDVYKLFASLGALPPARYAVAAPKKRKLNGIFSPDKTIRYAALSAGLFALCALFGFSVVPAVCAVICAAFTITSLLLTLKEKRKHKQKP